VEHPATRRGGLHHFASGAGTAGSCLSTWAWSQATRQRHCSNGGSWPPIKNARLAEFVEEAGYARLRAGTVADLLDRWVEVASPRWATTTDQENRHVVSHYLKPLLGRLRLGTVTTADVNDLYRHLSSCGRDDGGPLAASTVRRVHGVLHRAFAQAVRWEWVWLNPVSNASPPRAEPAEICPPTVHDVRGLLDHVSSLNPVFVTFLRLAASTGARRSQLLGLRWAEIDVEHRAIGFTRAYVEGRGGPMLRATKTHLCYRVSIDDVTMALLLQHWRRALERAHAAGVKLTAAGFVFSDDVDGARPWKPNQSTKTFIDHRLQAMLPHSRLHDLRHFMATKMLAHGVPVPTVSQRLGHARVSTTLNVYAHRIPGADRQAADLVADHLDYPLPSGTTMG
jgi:integrase